VSGTSHTLSHPDEQHDDDDDDDDNITTTLVLPADTYIESEKDSVLRPLISLGFLPT